MSIYALTKTSLDKIISCMCESTLSLNLISSYTITKKLFYSSVKAEDLRL